VLKIATIEPHDDDEDSTGLLCSPSPFLPMDLEPLPERMIADHATTATAVAAAFGVVVFVVAAAAAAIKAVAASLAALVIVSLLLTNAAPDVMTAS